MRERERKRDRGGGGGNRTETESNQSSLGGRIDQPSRADRRVQRLPSVRGEGLEGSMSGEVLQEADPSKVCRRRHRRRRRSRQQ